MEKSLPTDGKASVVDNLLWATRLGLLYHVGARLYHPFHFGAGHDTSLGGMVRDLLGPSPGLCFYWSQCHEARHQAGGFGIFLL